MTVCEIAKCEKCGNPVSVVFERESGPQSRPVCGRCADRDHYERQRQTMLRKFDVQV